MVFEVRMWVEERSGRIVVAVEEVENWERCGRGGVVCEGG